jgi:dTDP-4-amino-4,6-dideoxygalactose transaminase
VIVPHLFGRPARIDLLLAGLEKLDRRRDVLVLDDAAQSFGARLGGRWLGTFPDAGIVSFGPAKTITASGGGLLLTGSAGLAEAVEAVTPVKAAPGEKLRALAYWLVFRRWRRYTLPAYPVFRRWLVRRTPRDRDLPEALANVDAALAVPQLERLQDTIRLRGERKERLDALISACRIALASAPPVEAGVEANTRWVAREERAGSPAGDLVREFCLREGLEIQPLYQPLHLKRGTPVPADLRKSEALAKRIVQFPIESSVSRRAWRRLEHKLAGHLARAAREAQAPSGRNAASGAGPSPD